MILNSNDKVDLNRRNKCIPFLLRIYHTCKNLLINKIYVNEIKHEANLLASEI